MPLHSKLYEVVVHHRLVHQGHTERQREGGVNRSTKQSVIGPQRDVNSFFPKKATHTHCVMSGVVTECFMRTGRETIPLSCTTVVSVALRSDGSTGRPQGPRVT
jgi:hypothetical protein